MGPTFLVCRAAGAISTFSGEYVRQWQDHSLLYARVMAVTNTARDQYQVTVDPLATLTGTFDCGLSARLAVRLYIGFPGRIEAAPEPGATVLMLVYQKSPLVPGAGPRPGYVVSPDIVEFMPGGSGCVRVSGMEDKTVAEVMDRVRRARAANKHLPGE